MWYAFEKKDIYPLKDLKNDNLNVRKTHKTGLF